MMRRLIYVLACLALFSISCNLAASMAEATTPTSVTTAVPASPLPASATPTQPPTVPPTATLTAAPTQKPTVTRPPTLTPTATPDPRLDMAQAIGSAYWADLGLPEALAAKWKAFASGGELSAAELQQVDDFLAQWKTFNEDVLKNHVPDDASLALRAQTAEGGQGGQMVALYALGTPRKSQEQSFYLIARDEAGKAVGLVLAPQILEMEQRLSPDGKYVEYVGIGDNRALIYADAYHISGKRSIDKVLKEQLEDFYRLNHPYVKASMYPRFFFPVEDVDASFFTVEKNLTRTQLVRMHEAFELYARPELKPIKEAMYNANVTVIILERLYIATGLNYIGTGVIELDRQDLMGNRYDIAEVLAHEGSHVLQGPMHTSSEEDSCRQRIAREVGDKTIATDFSSWTAEQLITAILRRQVGAYHVSLWMMNQLGITGRQIDWLQSVIRTGKVNGYSVAFGCK